MRLPGKTGIASPGLKKTGAERDLRAQEQTGRAYGSAAVRKLMPTENAERAGVQVIREFPTVWTFYPADIEDEQERQQEEARKRQRETAAEEPNQVADHS